ncbi:MAG: SusD/RagB family nutrient-binding outer membrane lipoprotein, partial [Saprospiraceae bacterium]|nr:SusD/RagB family nutrient-binding outer membrane lipoprotein [Saprospiraceae bacterium]
SRLRDAFFPVYPSRFLYPSKEKALNAENYNTVIARQGIDEITTKLWWEKK